ncbi:recombinase family protein [Flavobacterium nitrogenifigens]|uniref:Site-specific DNA recombinase n=1 Tax=Flavobacterium nitrogenifigens TaxID=1617283 RepID=A0A521AFE4_9FLAO|nr:recombinase family protein [Flavobacterium nitrogenifigens]KAF2331491.1 recombinase family protein [Flavobacterium nitrogenifigens]SMO33488.1 Site-specific DNA recombinase [Flavobacterium nitrogenifigens]
MIAKYIRISDKSQNTERQVNDSDKLYVDVISGKTKFADRPQAQQLMQDIEAGLITQVTVHEVSRLGRNLLDILGTLEYMTTKSVNVYVHNIGMHSLIDGKESGAFKMVVTILANIAEQELNTLRERQAEGVRLAKEKGVYKGREAGSKFTPAELCGKHPDIIKYLQRRAKQKDKSYSVREIASITKKNPSTVQRVSKAFQELGGKFYYNKLVDPFA